MLFALIAGGIILLLVLWVVAIYNRLVRLRNMADQAWGDIDVQLTRRFDLIPNLVETVRGYASHERETLEKVIQARNTAVAATSPAELAAADTLLTGMLRQVFALAEQYPDLKADANFRQLQAELTNTESQIATSRNVYNNAVQQYNTARDVFPATIVAGMFSFNQREYFRTEDPESRGPVRVEF